MADFKLNTPKLRVIRGSLESPEILEVQAMHPDLTAFDMTRRKHAWGTAQEETFRWLSFLAWHALRRENAIPQDLRFETWDASLIEVQNVEVEDVPPTQEDPGLD